MLIDIENVNLDVHQGTVSETASDVAVFAYENNEITHLYNKKAYVSMPKFAWLQAQGVSAIDEGNSINTCIHDLSFLLT